MRPRGLGAETTPRRHDVGNRLEEPVPYVLGILIGLLAGFAIAWIVVSFFTDSKLAAARRTRNLLLEEARREADALRRESELAAKEEASRLRDETERQLETRRAAAIEAEQRMRVEQEDATRKLEELHRREQGLADREVHARQLQEDLKEAKQQELHELERIAGLTTDDARAQVLARSEELVRHELARRVRQLDQEAQADARRRARNLVADALQRVAASHAAETTVSIVELASDDMKGRIIGREGRNIRALEHLTGVDFIVDDTPQAVVLSSFDGIRREVAKLTLQRLLE